MTLGWAGTHTDVSSTVKVKPLREKEHVDTIEHTSRVQDHHGKKLQG